MSRFRIYRSTAESLYFLILPNSLEENSLIISCYGFAQALRPRAYAIEIRWSLALGGAGLHPEYRKIPVFCLLTGNAWQSIASR